MSVKTRAKSLVYAPIEFKGSRMARVFLKWIGWRYVFNGLPAAQGVIVGYPHTSNWDFVVMMLVKWAIGLQLQFFTKHSLFHIPVFGRWLRWIGATPIDRSSSKGVVGEMVDVLKHHKQDGRYLWLALSPEGTRKLTAGWRSGFYQLALGADVPLCLLRIDYAKKEAHFDQFMYLTGDVQADYANLAKAFTGVGAFHAAQASPIRSLPPRPRP